MCYSLWYNAPTMLPAGNLEAEKLRFQAIMHPRCCRQVAWKGSSSASRLPAGNIVDALYQAVTQSSVPEDGQNNCPKHVELTGMINKLLLLHLVGCLHYLYQ